MTESFGQHIRPPFRGIACSHRSNRWALWIGSAALAGAVSAAEPVPPPSIEALLKSLESVDFGERERALDGLSAQRDAAGDRVPELRERLRDSDRESRQRAGQALAALGVSETAVIDELISGMERRVRNRYLNGPDPALTSLSALVKLGAPAVPALVKAMENPGYTNSDWVVMTLGRMGPQAREAVPALLRRMESDTVAVQCAAIEAKWRIDGDAVFVRERAIPLLDLKGGLECNGAVHTLALLGPDAVPVLPAVIAALEKYEHLGVLYTLAGLACHAPEQVLPVLRRALDNPRLADAAAEHLQNLGEPSGPLIRHQLKRLKASAPEDGSDPMRIIYTIVVHGPEATVFLDDLVALLKHETPAVRRAAAWGLPRIFAPEAPVVAALKQAASDPATAEEAARSLGVVEQARR
ncbi:MAG: hypothetical protein ACKV19_27285 [Verrucomicrobiales bacterium]